MATYTYASTVSKLPLTDFSITAESGGSTTQNYNYTYHVSVLCRGGKNLDSDGVTVAIAPGQRLKITLNASIRKQVSEEFKILLSADTGTNTQAKILAHWDAKDSQETDLTLPVTIYLTTDSQFVLGGEVASSPNLPSSDRIKGMVRYVIDVAQYKQWDGSQWSVVSGWSTYLSSTTQARTGTLIYGGCDRAIATLDESEIILPPTYQAGTDSILLRMWILNGLTEGGGTDIQAGESVDLLVKINESLTNAIALNESIFVEVGQTLRKLDCSGTDNDLTGIQTTWSSGSDLFRLPVSLPRGYGIELIVSLSSDQLADGETVSISPRIKGKRGDRNTAAIFLGSCVLPGGDGLKVIPSLSGLRRLSGSALIATYNNNGIVIDGYSFNDPDPDDLTGLAADTAGQKVAISGALGGYTSIYQPNTSIPKDRAIRAIASTISGTATPSSWTSTIQLTSNQILSLTIAHPCNSDGIGTIRANYPDVIAGEQAEFNANFYIYLEISGTIQRSPLQSTNFQPNQTIPIDGLTGWTTVNSLPVSPSPSFCLWGYGSASLTNPLELTAIAGTGSLTTNTNIRVCIAYHYPSPNTRVTAISHSPNDGCTPELGITLIEAVERSQYSGLINADDSIRGYLEDKLVSSDEITIDVEATSLTPYPVYWRSPVDLIADLNEIESPIDGETRLCRENSRPYWWDGDGWIAIAGTGTGGSMSATDIRNALQTLNNTNRLNADSVKDGSTNLFLTTAERGKLTNLPGNTNEQLGLKANTTDLNTLESELETAIATKLNRPATAPTQTGMNLVINPDFSVEAVNQTPVGSTTTTKQFVQPAIELSITVEVENGLIFVIGVYVFMSLGGLYEVTGRSANTLTLINRNTNSWPQFGGSNVASGQLIIPSGRSGRDGVSAIAYTTDSFNIPALNATQQISLDTSDPFIVGASVKIAAAGTFEVASINGAIAITIRNIGNPDVATVGTPIVAGAKVVTVGLRGATGSVESATALELEQQSGDVVAIADKTLIFAKTDDKLYARSPSNSPDQIILNSDLTSALNTLQTTLNTAIADKIDSDQIGITIPDLDNNQKIRTQYLPTMATGYTSITQIVTDLTTLTSNNRLGSDAIKQDSSNLFLTTTERNKLTNVPSNTNQELADLEAAIASIEVGGLTTEQTQKLAMLPVPSNLQNGDLLRFVNGNLTRVNKIQRPIFAPSLVAGDKIIINITDTEEFTKIIVKSDSGTATITAKINSTNITGWTSREITTTSQTFTATANNIISVASDTNQLVIDIISASSPTNVSIYIESKYYAA